MMKFSGKPGRASPGASWGRMARFGLGLVAGLLVTACTLSEPQLVLQSCADPRLDLASSLYEEAKDQFAVHFQQRRFTALNVAYRSSKDAVLVARSTRGCYDFDVVTRRRALSLIRSNLLFQKLVLSNMRDQDPEVVVGLFGEMYQDIFKNDIH